MRRLMTQALVQQVAPDTRTAALIALVHAAGVTHLRYRVQGAQ